MQNANGNSLSFCVANHDVAGTRMLVYPSSVHCREVNWGGSVSSVGPEYLSSVTCSLCMKSDKQFMTRIIPFTAASKIDTAGHYGRQSEFFVTLNTNVLI